MMTEQGEADQKLIDSLVESGKLSDEQLAAFEDIKSKSARYRGELTSKQREWATELALRLDVDLGAANLVSSGKVRASEKERASVKAFVDSLDRPKLPPHRRK
jgi:polyhydroxyalkanoate synthesis regulator phasin